jgi:hypothetical protein
MKENDVRRPYLLQMKQVVDKLLSRKGEVSDDMLDFSSALLSASSRIRRAEINASFFSRFGGVIQNGPFEGMLLVPAATWGDGHIASKLLGLYEAELHNHIKRMSRRSYDCIINVGCAEGFYAVGFARLFPRASVFAFDIDQNALSVCAETARRNYVDPRITVGTALTHARFQELLMLYRRALVVVDIEGAERELLDPLAVPRLNDADVIVECHDFQHPGLTGLLKSRFANSHSIDEVRESTRDANSLEILANLSALDKAMITCEFRPARQSWLVMDSHRRRSFLDRLFGREGREN